MKPLISIVVPIFNVQNYIDDCIQSIISQTYTNIEIILVDDGSTDKSGIICDEYKKKDNRIKVIHKKNGGVSDARNVAIDIFKGKFITFIDGDDIVSVSYVDALFRILSMSNSQIAICAHSDFTVKVPTQSQIVEIYDYEIYSSDNAIKEILTNGAFTTSPWGKLYDRNLFDNIRYPKGKICEDLSTTWRLFEKTDRIVFRKSPEYFYRQNPNSLMNSRFNIRNYDIIEAHESVLAGLSIKKPYLLTYAKERFGTYATIQLYHALRSGVKDITGLKKFRKPIRKYIVETIFGSYQLRIKFCSIVFSIPGILELCVSLNKIRK